MVETPLFFSLSGQRQPFLSGSHSFFICVVQGFIVIELFRHFTHQEQINQIKLHETIRKIHRESGKSKLLYWFLFYEVHVLSWELANWDVGFCSEEVNNVIIIIIITITFTILNIDCI